MSDVDKYAGRRPFGKVSEIVLPKDDGVIRSSWMGRTEPSKDAPSFETPITLEDEYEQLMVQLSEGAAYDIIQLSPDLLGLVVNGELRATYVKKAIFTSGSTVAKLQLEAAQREAQRARNVVRSFDRSVKRAGQVRRDVGESATDGLDPQVEDSGLERWTGPLTRATEAERAIARDRRRAATGTDGDQAGPVFEKEPGRD